MRFFVGLVMVGLAACGADEAEVACEDFVDAAATRISDGCMLLSREDAEAQVLAAIRNAGADDGCSDVDDVRDRASFYEECLPMLEVLECSRFMMSDGLPASCQGQFIVDP
jgi:hypothetical protein